METICRETDSGKAIFEHRIPMQARLIVALMLGWFPAFFLYHLVNALIHYVRFATAAEWLSAFPGLLLVLVLFLGPGLVVWMVLVGQDRLVVDLARGQVTQENDLRFYTRTRSARIDAVREVKVGRKGLGVRGGRSSTWAIRLVFEGDVQPMTVGYEDLGHDAQEVAKRVAGYLHLE